MTLPPALKTSVDGTRSVSLSVDGRYRYLLAYRDPNPVPKPAIVWAGLNPSTATHEIDDPTQKRIFDFSFIWGFGRVYLVNMFAIRTPHPDQMMAMEDPIGPDNKDAWAYAIREAHEWNREYEFEMDRITFGHKLDSHVPFIAAWGATGTYMGQDQQALGWLEHNAEFFPVDLFCLGLTKYGRPRHPLYLAKDTKPEPWL